MDCMLNVLISVVGGVIGVWLYFWLSSKR